MKHYLACYDISDNKKRLKLSKLLNYHGVRVQKSVFEIGVKSEAQLSELKQKAQQYIEPFDSLLFYRLNYDSRQASQDIHGTRIAYFPSLTIIK